MGFGKMMELLQIKNKGKIVFCNAGNFYIAIGKDAVLLKELLGLKLSCFKPEVCKVGFPIVSLEKYMGLIEETGYGYIVYYLDKEKSKLEIITQYNGKNTNKILKDNDICYKCAKSTKLYKKEDKYILAVTNLYETEIQEEKTKKEAKQALKEIEKFLKANLELELNKKTQIFKNKQGVNFCGYKINEYRMKLRDKGKRKLKKKVKKLTQKIEEGKMTSKEARRYLAGHMGYIKYANVNNLLEKLFYIEN